MLLSIRERVRGSIIASSEEEGKREGSERTQILISAHSALHFHSSAHRCNQQENRDVLLLSPLNTNRFDLILRRTKSRRISDENRESMKVNR